MFHGAQIAVDITFRSATSSDGWPQPNTAHTNGAHAGLARAGEAKNVWVESSETIVAQIPD